MWRKICVLLLAPLALFLATVCLTFIPAFEAQFFSAGERWAPTGLPYAIFSTVFTLRYILANIADKPTIVALGGASPGAPAHRAGRAISQ